MGVVLLWRIAQPGDLRYTDAVPRPGSPAAVVTGAVWLSAAVLFVAAAVLVAVDHRRWAAVAVLATALSVPVLAFMASATRVGLAVDVVVLLAVLLTAVTGRRRQRERTGD
ncbi:hypothetical protein [Streptomyces sp. T028]|uniref:hypothetical protein n=1 Tax=Streptomyces sp. T028 TaxID=3394379 RepID=UPI003A873D36